MTFMKKYIGQSDKIQKESNIIYIIKSRDFKRKIVQIILGS